MNEQEKVRAIEITRDIKSTIRGLLDKHSTEVSQLNIANDDPHTPVIGCTQMALAQASVEYLITCGCTPNEAVKAMLDTGQHAMNQWLNSVLKPVNKTRP